MRAAAKLSRSIGEFDELPHDEQAKWLALCLLDGEGEQWMHIVQAVRNGMLGVCAANGAKISDGDFVSLDDVERFQQFNPARKPVQTSLETFAAIEATMRNQILGGR